MTSHERLIGSSPSFSVGLHDPAEFADRPTEDLGSSLGGSTNPCEFGGLSCPFGLGIGHTLVVSLDGDFPRQDHPVERISRLDCPGGRRFDLRLTFACSP
ncbi:hypothetical protein AB0L64_39850 [Kribbella sp. NPDC051936]|uniref:hypothetical protein n=1 Tax=Kribbella sp. NPDC051936 TaxID=3154946 RepID=UPI0034461B97